MGSVTLKNNQPVALVARLLRPILRFALRRGVYARELMETVKRMLVEVAHEELQSTGGTINSSRLSVVTGMTRHEVTH